MDKEEIEKMYKAIYMQNPFEILTEENLQRLEEHCKKAIHYERGNVKQEHEITLSLLYRYLEQKEEIDKLNKIIDEMANCIWNYDICDYEITDYTYRKCEYIADDEEKPCKECIKQYFEKKVEGK